MRKTEFSERVMALILAFAITFGMSFSVLADESETLNDKILNAEEGSTITLDKDYVEDIVIPSGKSIILDLANYSLKGTDANAIATIKVEKGATLVIKGEGEIINNSIGNGAACIFNNGKVTIEGGTIKKETGNKSYYNITNHGEMIINGGTIVNDTQYEEGKSHASLVENGYYDYTSTNPVLGYVEEENVSNPSLVINGGTFDGGLNTIKNDDGASLVINDALVKNQVQVAVFNVSEAEINGGTFEVPAGIEKTTVFNRKYNNDINKGVLIVNGGEFNADYFIKVINNATEEQMGEIKINGGIFNTNVGLVNTESGSDITTLTISGGTYAQEPGEDKLAQEIEKKEIENGEWLVGKKVTLTLKYENSTEDVTQEYITGEEVILPVAEREEYEFKGWKKDEETTYNAEEKIKIEDDITLIAQWEEKQIEENNNSGDNNHNSGSTSHSGSENNNNNENEDNVKIIYSDVNKNDWFNEYVNKVTEMKVMNGVGNDKFAPNEEMTRAMAVTILYRYAKADVEYEDVFDDVSKDLYYSNAIAWAAKNKIINGIGDNKFAPDRKISREELATILYRYAKVQEKVEDKDLKIELEYKDKDEISDFAVEAITWCTKKEIIKGREDKVMMPKANASRAEAATMIVRFANK